MQETKEICSEGITHRKVPSEVPVAGIEIRILDGPPFPSRHLRVVCLHTGIETEEEEIEVQAKAQTIRYSYLFIEAGEIEVSPWMGWVFMENPDVPRIDKGSQLELPEQLRAILQI